MVIPPEDVDCHVILPPETDCFTVFHLQETLALRRFTSRKRLFYVTLLPEDACFYVVLPPANGDFTWVYLPKTFILRASTPRRRSFYVILHRPLQFSKA